MRKKSFFILIPVLILLILGSVLISKKILTKKTYVGQINTQVLTPSLSPTVTPTISKPQILSLAEMNKLYGPCVKLDVLMYHHVETSEEAKAKKQTGLATSPEFFTKHMQYLKDNGYTVVGPEILMGFFNGTATVPQKAVMITLDDGYLDNYTYAFPILKQYGFKAVIFTPTGLLNNPDYLSWENMKSMKDSVYFGNHTWSHHSSSGTKEVQEKEIGTADLQLSENGFNNLKIFAYPYGNPSQTAESILKEKGYTLAFTTAHGNIMCKGKYLELPRIRVGNAPLNAFGL